jgi:hypothetical protein
MPVATGGGAESRWQHQLPQSERVIKTFQHKPVEIHKFRMITDLEESRL